MEEVWPTLLWGRSDLPSLPDVPDVYLYDGFRKHMYQYIQLFIYVKLHGIHEKVSKLLMIFLLANTIL